MSVCWAQLIHQTNSIVLRNNTFSSFPSSSGTGSPLGTSGRLAIESPKGSETSYQAPMNPVKESKHGMDVGDAASMRLLTARVEEAESRSSTLEQQKEGLEEDALKAAAAVKKVESELADNLAKVISHEAENDALRRQAEGLEDQISALQVYFCFLRSKD